jgi:hypothetical protein
MDEPITFEKRSLHAERLRASRHHLVSTSLSNNLNLRRQMQLPDPSDDEDEDDDIEVEEGLLPSSLHDLIPNTRTRRNSRSRLVDDANNVFNTNYSSNGPQAYLSTSRRTTSASYLSSLSNQPQESKIGSPHHNSHLSSSPSRYSTVFQQQQLPRTSSVTNVFGHVGSPLRSANPSLPSPTTNGRQNGDSSPLAELGKTSLGSPPRQATMSMLTQGLQRSKISGATITPQQQRTGALDRSQSSTSVNGGGSSNGTATDHSATETSTNASGLQRSDEELEFFDMEGVDDKTSSKQSASATTNGVNGTHININKSSGATNPWTNGGFSSRSPPSSSSFTASSPNHIKLGSLSNLMARSSFTTSSSPRNGNEPTFGAIGAQRSAALS